MANTYTQEINPIKSDIWMSFLDQQTVNGIKVTKNYGRYSLKKYVNKISANQRKYIQLGDGITSSTYPSMIGSKGFRFKGFEYLDTNSFTLSDNFSIGMLIRPKLVIDGQLCGFSNDGGIIVRDTASSNELTYYDGTTRISSGVVLEKEHFYFVVVTKDASNNVKFYINGDLEGSGVGTDTGFDLDYIGCDDSIGNFYFGEIRGLFVFADVLVSTQINELNDSFYREIEEQDIYVPTVSDPLSDAELAGWDGLQVWLDPLNTSDLTMATQPTLVDADMEAVGTAAYASVRSAILSKETSSPHGGAQVLRVKEGGQSLPLATACATIVSNRYHPTGWARSDGNIAPNIYDGTTSAWAGTTSTAWQAFEGEFTCTINEYRLGLPASPGTGYYCEFDDIAIENLSITSIAPRAGALSSAFSQATATAQPWKDSTTGAIRFDGTADKLTYAGAASNFDFLHTADCALFIVAKFDSVTGYNSIISNYNGDGLIFRNQNNTTNLDVNIRNDAGVFDLVSTGNEISVGNMQVFDLHINSTLASVYVDGALAKSRAFTASTGATTTTLTVGTQATSYFPGETGDVIAFNRSLSATEKTRLRNKLAAKWGITLP